MRTLLSAVVALGLCCGVYADNVPTHVTPVNTGGISIIDVPNPPLNPGDEIYNTLDITNNQQYDTGNGDAWSGQAVFGFIYDLQAADDVEFESDCCLGDTTRDYVGFSNTAPANGSYSALHADTGCLPDNAELGSANNVPSTTASFQDTLFFLVGKRITAHGDGSICGSAGVNYVVQQYSDQSSSGDWAYSLADLNQVIGCDRALRDGGKATGGYGFTTWRSGGNSGFGSGTHAMAVSVKCGPPVPRCVYRVKKAKNLADPCGKVCDQCPYARGNLICTNECRSDEDCASKLKGYSACPNGAACLVKGTLVGCIEPPRDCRRCR